MSEYLFFIDDWKPTLTNVLLKSHWAVAAKKKKKDFETVWAYSQRVPKAKGKRHLSVTVYIKGKGRTPDPDSLFKSLLDALVKNKLLVDDSSKWLEADQPKFIRGKFAGTQIVLRDI